MPCNGIAVLTALTAFDFEAHFARDPQHREEFAAWLAQYGLPVKGWWPSGGAYRPQWALGIGSDWVGLKFTGSAIEMSNERTADLDRHRADLDRAFSLAQTYAGMQVQAQIVEACVALGLNPQNVTCGGYGVDVLAFTINAGITILIKAHLDGRLEFITQEGDFETGKTTLEALVTALNAQGAAVQPTGQVETHRHDLESLHLHQHTRS
jgi:hypothetical protein